MKYGNQNHVFGAQLSALFWVLAKTHPVKQTIILDDSFYQNSDDFCDCCKKHSLILNPNMLISHCQLVRVECWWFISDDAISVVLNQKAVDSIVSFCRCSCCVLLRVFRSRARCCIKHSLILKPNMLISHRQLVRVECWLFRSQWQKTSTSGMLYLCTCNHFWSSK